MAIKSVVPYLNFAGTGRDAIALYQRVLGAKPEGQVMPFEKDPNRVMHAMLTIGGGSIMLSDVPPTMSVPNDSNAHVSLDFDDAAEMKRAFDGLADGGHVTMPLQDTFWGATFGMLTDLYGIRWMFNCQKR